MNYENKGFEYNGTRYYVEEQDQSYFFYTWYEEEKIFSEPIPKDRIECLSQAFKGDNLSSETTDMARRYIKSLIERAMYDIEKKINQIKVNRILYKAEMERKDWEQADYDKI
jgi:hypothetical protein